MEYLDDNGLFKPYIDMSTHRRSLALRSGQDRQSELKARIEASRVEQQEMEKELKRIQAESKAKADEAAEEAGGNNGNNPRGGETAPGTANGGSGANHTQVGPLKGKLNFKTALEKGLRKVPDYFTEYKAPAAKPATEKLEKCGLFVREIEPWIREFANDLNERVNLLEQQRVTDGKIIHDLCQLALEGGIPTKAIQQRLTPLQQIAAEKKALKTEKSKEKIQFELRILDLPEVEKFYEDGQTHKVKEKENVAKYLNRFIKKKENKVKHTDIEYAKRLRTKDSPAAKARTPEHDPDVLIVGLKNKDSAVEAEFNYRSFYNIKKMTDPKTLGKRQIQKSMTLKQRQAQKEAYELCQKRNENKMAKLGLKSLDELEKIWIVRYENGDPDPRQVTNKNWSGYVDADTFEANKAEILKERRDRRKAEKAARKEENKKKQEAAKKDAEVDADVNENKDDDNYESAPEDTNNARAGKGGDSDSDFE